MGVPAHHEQPYSQIVLKIRALTRESHVGGLAPLEDAAGSSRAGVSPVEVQRLFTAHFFANYAKKVSGRTTQVFAGNLASALASMTETHQPRLRDSQGHQQQTEYSHVFYEVDHLPLLCLLVLNCPEIMDAE
jgi:hypothetical protein